ncbi:4-hydroxy-2-oxoheptanedioate aldolase [Gemmobacter caeni]|uniref:4-hydroxy-2-oxoheptanedioate aldolase n=1 Tax=Gemmobacter caeni TaxID=589035 RepID=A0A2T6AUQ0_9RHOB|nr:aldolase/citrate lyase family protein [Gemmobacter caeni]OJY34457.1 MAG: 4-hydroxy-2-oxovalerate aldolase [Rhodobacterales bacterium 65-51]PTX47552.1 4-hydroxy-2-oxoheptanedioate aldolase [Gemmobacter caeni]TWI97743.1 4-hydroxy-2-oxoheptanedioate aldolase [Gemmobacter caeni]
MTDFRSRCIAPEPLAGLFCAIPHPTAVEICAATAPDFLCLDGEHAPIGRERAEEMIRAAQLHGVPVIMRVPGHLPDSIAGVLDSGADGVLVPRVSTTDEARAAVAATRYPPVGVRGVGPGRAAGFGYRIPDYLATANSRILLAIQAETPGALENIEDIAAVEGVDVIFIGPGDLGVTLGALGPEGRPRLMAAIKRITKVSRAAGKAVGMFCASPDEVPGWRELGITFFLIGNDARHLADAAGAAVARAREGF